MKKIIAAILAFSIIGGAMPAYCRNLASSAADITISPTETKAYAGGIYYDIYDTYAVITGFGDKLPANCVIEQNTLNVPIIRIEDDAFANCETLKSLTMPDTITEIGRQAFEGCVNLESVRFSNSLLKIDVSAFRNCESLREIDLPDYLTDIYMSAFRGCKSLESVKLPKTLETLESIVFEGCTSLESIYLPDSLQTIGAYMFSGCTSLREIKVAESNPSLFDIDGVLFTKEDDLIFLTCYPAGRDDTEYIIPDSIIAIDPRAFEYAKIQSVTIPESVKAVNSYAFYGCSELESLTIPADVEYIYANPALACDKMTAFHVDENNENYCDINGVLFRKDKTSLIAFPSGKAERYTVPDFVESIGVNAFSRNNMLKSVTVPKSVTMIDEGAFGYCSSLETLKILNPKCEMKTYLNIVYNKVVNKEYIFNGTIYADKMSPAYFYASEHGYNFKELGEEIFYGDANCDGEIQLADSVLILQSLSNPDGYGVNGTNPEHITEQGMINADCSGSGNGLTTMDALAIQKYLLKLITLPEE